VAAIDPALVAGLVRDPAVSTSYTVILSPPGLDRIFLHCPGANDSFDAGDIDYELVRQARLFHFGYPPVMRRMYSQGGHGLVEVFRRAKAAGATTSLDMTSPDPLSEGGQADWISILRRTLPYVDIFLPSFEELLFMLRRELHDELQRATGGDLLSAASPELVSGLGQQLIDMGVHIAVIKMGSCGLFVRTGSAAALAGMGRGAPADPVAWADRELRSACFQVQVVGTTGSGDATIAGFLSALLRGLDLRQSATMAVAVGACNVEAADALSGLCSWEDTLARVQSGWPRRALTVEAPGWASAGSGLWEKVLPQKGS
jgi:sugar/nucleoside kinase (ribokinase family)